MKKVFFVVAFAVMFAATASAQDVKPFTFYVGGGAGVPSGPTGFKDQWKPGFHLSGGVGYNVMPILKVIGRLEYHAFQYDADVFAEYFGVPSVITDQIEGATYSTIMLGADGCLGLNLPGFPVQPYGILGGGVAFTRISDLKFAGETVMKGVSETKPYLNLAAGVELPMGPMMKLFVQGKFVMVMYDSKSSISGETATFVPITVGIKF